MGKRVKRPKLCLAVPGISECDPAAVARVFDAMFDQIVRLKKELAGVREAILSGADLRRDATLAKHAEWIEELQKRHTFTPENTEEILRQEVGAVFTRVLEDAGVFKRTEQGRRAFARFLATI